MSIDDDGEVQMGMAKDEMKEVETKEIECTEQETKECGISWLQFQIEAQVSRLA